MNKTKPQVSDCLLLKEAADTATHLLKLVEFCELEPHEGSWQGKGLAITDIDWVKRSLKAIKSDKHSETFCYLVMALINQSKVDDRLADCDLYPISYRVATIARLLLREVGRGKLTWDQVNSEFLLSNFESLDDECIDKILAKCGYFREEFKYLN